ncbi:TetR/AcrR family transcriptional regulator [Agrobacterium tumefaciens]|nr:helix-turn-helix domain containing protein [Rhizobium rhizogenes]NTE56559.1 TetR/AcrR family transcriptional regulator [Agrobacterium tumefaciens]NTE74527.1 TetR/AcrR family transcriptional regulator [Agrobacterium tumefaciens]
MRITQEKKQENHDRIVAKASEVFRERGFDGIGVADLMDAAGFTHGGFYNHFRSKEELIAKATEKGFAETAKQYAGMDSLAALDLYLSRAHRDARGQGCSAAALGCDAARQPEETRSAFGNGIEAMVDALAHDISKRRNDGTDVRAKAISVLAQAVGAVILSRACPDDSALADEFLDACRADCRDAIEHR